MHLIVFLDIKMISKKQLVFRAVLSGILTVIFGVIFALVFPTFTAMKNNLFATIMLYIVELFIVHCILCFLFKRKTGEKFLYKNIVVSEGVGAIAFVSLLSAIVNNSFDLLFVTIVGSAWACIALFWNALDDENKKNENQKKQKNKKKQKRNKKKK